MVVKKFRAETWRVSDIIQYNDSSKLILPKYQRGLVWSKTQKEKLISTIQQGSPFGSVLLHQKGEKYAIIDGLQRITTILQYNKNPNLYFTKNNIADDELIDEMSDLLGEGLSEETKIGFRDSLLDVIELWVKSKGGFTARDRWDVGDLIEFLSKSFHKFGLDEKKIAKTLHENLEGKLRQFIDNIRLNSDIRDASVPVIITLPSLESELPYIFEKVNTAGTKLSKYQILAATWSDSTFHFSNSEIEQEIREWYSTLPSENYELEDYDPDDENYEFNLFEYLLGFNRLLIRKYPHLFGEGSEGNPFLIYTLCLGLPVSKMKDLGTAMGKIDDTDNLEKAIFESINFVSNELKTYLSFKIGRQTIPHSQHQLISLIVKTFNLRYYIEEGEVKERSDWNSTKQKWKKKSRASVPLWSIF